jgi:predicted solute-binding protein
MSPPSLRDELRRTGWRIGSVPYLNARPLIYGIEDRVTLCESARLADLMHRQQFDVGLVPVAETLLHDQYDIVDGIAIAGCGAVKSVFLAHRVPVGKLKRVAVNPASRTSAWLVRVVLKQAYRVEPEFYPLTGTPNLGNHEAMMLFGDGAIWYRHRNGDDGLLDLGEAWTEMTGLPFVFAVWAVQRGAANDELVGLLRKAKADGLAHIEEIVQESTEATPEFRREYLTRNVCFDLGEAEKAGLRRFQGCVKELGLIKECHELRFIG